MLQSAQLCNTPECAIQASALPEELYHKLNDMETATVGPAMVYRVYRPRSTIAQALSILRKGGINIRVREAEAETISFELAPANNGIKHQTIPFLPLDDSVNYLLEKGARRISTPQPSLDHTTDSHFPPVRKVHYELELNGQRIILTYS